MARALAAVILLLSAHGAAAQPADWEVERGHHHNRGARILVLKDYHLETDATARGPVIVLGGSATIDGHADDDVVVLGGTLRVGPKAQIDGDVVTVGREALIDPQARVHGQLKETVVRWPEGEWDPFPRQLLAGLALVATILRLLLVLVVAAAITLVAPDWVRAIASRVAGAPGAAAVIGLACEIAFAPVVALVVVALAISLVGIPLIGVVPLLIAAAGVVATAGFAAVAARIGARIRGTSVEASSALFGDVLIGFAAVTALSVLAHLVSFGPFWTSPLTMSVASVGWVVEWIVWTIGIGAACASLFARWKGPMPVPGMPPMPPTAPAPTTI
jgi:hypothetical protein